MATKDPTFAPPLAQLLSSSPVLTSAQTVNPTSIAGFPSDPTQALFGDGWARGGARVLYNEIAQSARASFDILLPQAGYRSLSLGVYARFSDALTNAAVALRFNGDSGANYEYEFMTAASTVNSAGESISPTFIAIANVPAATAPANNFGVGMVDIPAHASTVGWKQLMSRYNVITSTATGGIQTAVLAGIWKSTAAITRLTLTDNSGGNFVTGSRVALWGY